MTESRQPGIVTWEDGWEGSISQGGNYSLVKGELIQQRLVPLGTAEEIIVLLII